MAEPLKNAYNSEFLDQILASWEKQLPTLNKKQIHDFVFAAPWDELELKGRMSRLAESMQIILPSDFKEAVPTLKKLVQQLIDDDYKVDSFECMFIPEYVEKEGIAHFKESMEAMELITQYTSCEFAIRPFIIRYEDEAMQQMQAWSKHKHSSVRRLSSEGCRSRLPWAMALNNFKKDPSKIIPIVEQLKNDPSLYVRKSVANNLNDISKDHPEITLKLANKWLGKTKETDWIVKHGCRTLLKDGNPVAMQLFGYAPIDQLSISSLKLKAKQVDFGSAIPFEFSLRNKTDQELIVRIEYAVYLLKQNGTHSKKVFKISERNLEGKQSIQIERFHPFKPITTRTYYAGEHKLSLIINGIEGENHSFLLNM